MTRLLRAWHALEPDQRLAAVAAVALFLTMFLPWYQQNAVVDLPRAAPLQSRNLNAFAVFSFVEAAVLLVAVAVLCLLFARAEQRAFHLPGSDGAVVLAAGIWTALLLVLRLFDKPGISSHGVAANIGIQWGIFFALGAAGLLAYAGSRMRASARPEPPLVRPPGERPRRTRPPADLSEDETTTILASRAAPAASRPAPVAARPAPATPAAFEPPRERPRLPPAPSPAAVARRRRPVAGADADQLSFEDQLRPDQSAE